MIILNLNISIQFNSFFDRISYRNIIENMINFIWIYLVNNLQKSSRVNPNAKQSNPSNDTEGFDTSDELLDNLVKNAALTATKDAVKQRRLARYAQRQSCISVVFEFDYFQ